MKTLLDGCCECFRLCRADKTAAHDGLPIANVFHRFTLRAK